MELERRRSSGVAKGGLTTGIIGTSLGALNSLALMGAGVGAATRAVDNAGWNNNGWGWGPGYTYGAFPYGYGPYAYGATPQTVVINTNEEANGRHSGYGYGGYGEAGCSENHLVNRYELGLEQQIAKKDSEIALRDANIYNDQKLLEVYKYIDGELKDIRQNLSAQAVVNQKTADSFELVKQDIDCCCNRLAVEIQRERDERKCDDNIIVTYANSTFYPQRVADVTVGTTTTAERTYNPLCCCGGSNRVVVQQTAAAAG